LSQIEVRNVFKIFGPRPDTVLPLAREGRSKDDLLAETGHVLGLRDVSLSIEAGRTFVVMGLSGSGKSTLIRHLNRLIDPTAGDIFVDGVDILAMDDAALTAYRRHKVSMVFQRFGLLPHRTVLDNVAYGLAVQGIDKTERAARAREWVDAVGLGGYEAHYPDQLSGGMQQRVGLARALATDPEILLMDEPFGALDPLIRRDMQDQLMALQARLNKTIVFITHDLDEALRLGDRVAILKDGDIVQVGGPEEIVLRPADDYVRAFVEDVNRGRVLRAGALMLPVAEAEPPPAGGATVTVDTVIEDCLAALAGCEGPLAVLDRDGALAGLLPLTTALAALGGSAPERAARANHDGEQAER
jgi:glycine betaine/proline transport system ATP-binding protein